jgi:hypothetical protein
MGYNIPHFKFSGLQNILSPLYAVWLYTVFGLLIGFIELLQYVIANNYDSLTKLHTPKTTLTTTHIKSSKFAMPSPVVAW